MITKDITIEDLIEDYPKSVKYLAEHGIRCIKCGEPIWGTLEEACIEKDFSQEKIALVVKDLNEIGDGFIDNTEIYKQRVAKIKKIELNKKTK